MDPRIDAALVCLRLGRIIASERMAVGANRTNCLAQLDAGIGLLEATTSPNLADIEAHLLRQDAEIMELHREVLSIK